MKRSALWLLLGASSLAVLGGVGVISRREQALRDDEVKQQRATMYELVAGQTLSVPLEANVDAVRLVAHGFKRGSARPSAGLALLRARVSNAAGERSEQVSLQLSSKELEATSEDGELRTGDRTTLNLDTAEAGPGLLSVTLEEASGVDGLLVRFYRRESLSKSEIRRRHGNLTLRQRQSLAERAGELDWADLEAEARSALLGVRWAKVAALPAAESSLVAHVLAVQNPNAAAPIAADGEPSSPTDTAGSATPPELVDFTRVSPEQPLVVEADEAPLVLRLSARVPLAPGAEPERLQLLAHVQAPRASAQDYELSQVVRAAASDVYRPGGAVGPLSTALPSERAAFHVLVPAHGRVTVAPSAGVVDLSLAELDPQAAPRRARAADSSTETTPWNGFVTRRPSNFAAFAAASRGSLRLQPAPASTATSSFDTTLKRARVKRPLAVATIEHDHRSYANAASLDVDVSPAGTVLPLRLFSNDEVEVVVVIDDGSPRRRASGAPRFVTTSHALHFRGDASLSVMLGDDLEPGRHRVSLRYDRAVKVWLHAPWSSHPHRAQESAWVSAELQP